MIRKGLIAETAVIGLSSMAVAMLLQKAYKVTGYYPPNPVFYFAIGAGTHLAYEALGGNRWYVETRKAADMPKGLLG